MSDHVDYWWVTYNAATQPAEITFRGGIPIHARLIGSSAIVPAASIDLMERLPAIPRPVLQKPVAALPPPAAQSSGSLMWLIGIIAITLLLWFSGQIFDAIK